MVKNSHPTRQSLDHLQGTVTVRKRGWFRRLLAFSGPAYLVSVGYMDPGNWATDIEGGARFGYTLIWVLLMSNLMAVLLQTLSARLGIVTGYDLAQGCRREYPRPLNLFLWCLAEIAIAACDLAEVLGTIIALNLLFGLPLLWGCVVTAFDTFLLLAIQRLGVRKMEAFIVMLVGTIGGCFLIELFLAKPDWGGIAAGFLPLLELSALYGAIGIIGATVMPHNLYLHASLVQSRAISNTLTGKAEACKFNLIDSAIALNAAFFVNAAILVMSAADFHSRGILVTEIQQAHGLLEPILGAQIAPIAFAVALLAAGQSSTLTGTLAGQIVMEGFLNIRLRPWLRRLVTRGMALIPAVIVIALTGDEGTYKLLILSQVILSLQLPFATIPLIHFTSDRKKMGSFANPPWVKLLAWSAAAIIVALNLKLVFDELTGWLAGGPIWLWLTVIPFVLVVLGVLVYVTFGPLFRPGRVWESGITTASRTVAERIKPIPIKHIGVALEHAAGDTQVISAALMLAKPHKARLTLLHIVDTPGTMVYGDESQSRHGTEDEAYLEELAREIEAHDLSVETMLRYGKPVEGIIKSVEEAGFDLLVLGSHGHRGIEDVIHGQTVTGVRHGVKIPVLIIRTTPSGPERAQHEQGDNIEN
ncbi:Nramp family divalent metal transporter [Candidatus Poribacteria bacterium]|nr:Nramp family divalent metal transporter [Candidatus Poribacteria bacterium]